MAVNYRWNKKQFCQTFEVIISEIFQQAAEPDNVLEMEMLARRAQLEQWRRSKAGVAAAAAKRGGGDSNKENISANMIAELKNELRKEFNGELLTMQKDLRFVGVPWSQLIIGGQNGYQGFSGHLKTDLFLGIFQ